MRQVSDSHLTKSKPAYGDCDIIAEANFFHIVTDIDFRIMDMNQWAMTHLHTHKIHDDFLSIFDVFNISDDKINTIVANLSKAHQIQNLDLKLQIGNGVIYTIWNIKKTRMSGENRDYLHFFGHDVTERRKLELQLAQSEKLSAIGQMAAGFAHDISKPLTSISSLIQIMENYTDDEFMLSKFKIMDTQIEYLVKKVHQLVDLGRPMKGNKEKLLIQKVIEEAIRIINYDRLLKNITIKTVFCPEGIPLFLSFDQLLQVFINIILNAGYALQHSENPVIIISTHCSDKHINIDIQDNGEGIDADLLPHVFEPFMTTKKDKEGTGLGLWMCHNFISSMNGKIWLDSKAEKGTNVHIELPMEL